MSVSYSALILADGPEAYLPLDTDLLDATGHGHDASAGGSGPTATGAGPFGGLGAYTFTPTRVYTSGAYFFDTSGGSWLTLANPGTIPAGQGAVAGSSFSWEGWIRADAGGTGGFWVAATSGTTPAGHPQLWPRLGAIYTGSAVTDSFTGLPVPQLLFGDLTHGGRYSGTLSGPNDWHHVVLVWDGYVEGRVYLDCLEVDNSGGSGTPGAYDTYAPAAFALGATTPFALPRPSFTAGAFAGDIAQVALYPYGLSHCQVMRHYEAATGLRCCGGGRRARAQIQIVS